MSKKRSEPDPRESSRNDSASRSENSPTISYGELLGKPLSLLASNVVVAERYRIVRFIARGGMGEVYEAEDLELKEQVALKTIRSQIAEDPIHQERFRREVQLARKVTHPNVCRIFDVDHDKELTFLTMELLEGESLSQRIQKQGRMNPIDVLPIAHQMAIALEAAHKAGIIHRDFKSNNVMLVPVKNEQAEFRVVVTDFGLARRFSSEQESVSSLSISGAIAGTPAYIAPEQLTSGEITPAADQYAFGVVLYEMITGHLPFKGDTPLSTALQRLDQAPRSPRVHVQSISHQWEYTILKCLQRQPQERFSSVLEAYESLTAKRTSGAGRAIQFTVAAILLVLGLTYAFYEFRKTKIQRASSTVTAVPKSKPRASVAVLGFKNLSGDANNAWISTALSEMLATELSANEKLRTIPGEAIARMKVELALPESDSFAQDTLTRIRKNLSTDYVILGSYFVIADQTNGKIRFDFRIQNASTGELKGAVSEIGTREQFLDLVSRAGSQLRQKLGVGELAPTELAAIGASKPSNEEAAQYYAQGLVKLRAYDALAARELLQKAVDVEPDYALAHSSLSEAWSALGYHEKGKHEAKLAMDLSTKLSRQERLLIEANWFSKTYQEDKAAMNYAALWRFFPDNVEFGLKLTRSQVEASRLNSAKIKDAELTAQTLQKNFSGNPEVDLSAAQIAQWQYDCKRAIVFADKSEKNAAALDAKFTMADAKWLKGDCYRDLGKPGAEKLYLEAKKIYEESGNLNRVAYIQLQLAGLSSTEGKIFESIPLLNNSLQTFKRTGNRLGEADANSDLAMTLWRLGDYGLAKIKMQQVLDIDRELDLKNGMAISLTNMALLLKDSGDFSAAHSAAEQALVIRKEIGDELYIAYTQAHIALILAEQGHLNAAQDQCNELLKISREKNSKWLQGGALIPLGEIFLQKADFRSAKTSFDEALSIFTVADQSMVSSLQTRQARLMLEEGKYKEAIELERQALKILHKAKKMDPMRLGYDVLAISYLNQGKILEAKKTLNEVNADFPPTQSPGVRMALKITSARIDASSGKVEAARKSLKAVLEEAKKLGYLRFQFESRLYLGEIEVKYGNAVQGREMLSSLEKEAAQKDFHLISQKALATKAIRL